MRVAIFRLGAMGSRMAAALLAAGHSVVVWNRTPDRAQALVERGARLARTPREAVEDVEIAVATVRDDEASRRVWLSREYRALAGMPASAVGIESSTLSVAWVRELAQHFVARGVAFLDAPVVGSRAQADAAKLIHLVGGDAPTLERAQPVLSAVGSAAHHVGPTGGSGATLKLVVNAMLGVQVALLAELLGACKPLGLDRARAVGILGDLPTCSPAAKLAAQGMVARSFDPAFPVDLVEKDLRYLLDAVPAGAAPISATARGVFASARAAGHGEKNLTVVAELYS